MILITGATGNIGHNIVQGLQTANTDFVVLSRDYQKAKAKFGDATPVIEGSMENAVKWLPRLPSHLIIFSLAAVSPNMAEVESRFFDVLKAHGVDHIVKLSAWRASPESPVDIVRQHGQAEAILKTSGIPYTIIQAQYFMQNLLGFGGMVARTGKLILPMGTERCAPVNTADIAAVALQCLLYPNVHQGQTYQLTGPDLLNFHDIALNLSQVISKPISYEAIAATAFRQMLTDWGLSDWLANGMAEVFVSLSGGDATYTTNTVAQLTGRQAVSLRTFLEANRYVFS